MTLTITSTTLCVCHHVYGQHNENQDNDCTLCACGRFLATSRKSSSHYQRGQRTTRKRVARLAVGDRILVGFPGHYEMVRVNGRPVWEQRAGELTGHPIYRHVEDLQLQAVETKTGALVAEITGIDRSTGGWAIRTNLGELDVLPGYVAVHALLAAPSW